MKITLKRKVATTVMYILNFLVLLIPAYQLNESKYNLLTISVRLLTQDLEKVLSEVGIVRNDITVLCVATYIQIICVLLFTALSALYIIFLHRGKNVHINYLGGVFVLMFGILQMHAEAFSVLFGISDLSMMIAFLLIIITGIEIPLAIIMDRWDEAMAEAKVFEQKEKEEKEEKKERLKFEGKQNRLFYYIVWKNFKSNWKDYSLFLITNTILFAVIVLCFCMREILSGKYSIKKVLLFGGLSEIIVNAMIPMIILSIFTVIILFFYYVKCRSRNFGVFLTLGMRRKTLYYFTALEFISMFLLSLLAGGVIGRTIVAVIMNQMHIRMGIDLTLKVLSVKPYILAVLLMVVIYIVSMMAARDIFVDFNVGKSTDLRAIAEKLPGRKISVIFFGIGMILCLFSLNSYRKLYNYENEYLLLVFFIGMFLILRYGMALWIVNIRKKPQYLRKLMIHNQLFHKSKTNSAFMGILIITQFCILYYFSFQTIGALISEDMETLLPYDYVCLADDSDDELFARLEQDYQADVKEFSMVRVSAYDSTEALEYGGVEPVQGQHIGISESTYHTLKKMLDPSYVSKSLDLDKEGKDIHVVYQQDKSVKAQPTAFYSPRKEPLLHIGRPCRSIFIYDVRKKDIGYKYYDVKSEEIGSLTGVFRQGVRENVIVFSDEYFEKIKELWKTTNLWNGEQIEDEEQRIPDVTITQGVTKLVLINANTNENINKELEIFEKKHLEEERKIYETPFDAGIYDFSVSYHYKKTEMIESIETERIMKVITNLVAMILFLLMNIMILSVKMLSEKDLNVKRSEFLTCMGMYRKSRIKLIRGELMRYYIIFPFLVSSVSALMYTYTVFHARMYTKHDIQNYMTYFLPAAIVYAVGYFIVTYILTTIYAHRVEGLKYGRNS